MAPGFLLGGGDDETRNQRFVCPKCSEEPGIEPLRIRQESGRAVWDFEATEEVRQALESFYNRALSVDALAFSDLIRSSKGEVMNLRAL